MIAQDFSRHFRLIDVREGRVTGMFVAMLTKDGRVHITPHDVSLNILDEQGTWVGGFVIDTKSAFIGVVADETITVTNRIRDPHVSREFNDAHAEVDDALLAIAHEARRVMQTTGEV